MPANIRKSFNGIGIVPTGTLASDTMGELEVNLTGGKLNYYDGTSRSPVVTETSTATLTNKTLSSPTLTTPNLGVATVTSLNGNTITTGIGTLTLSTFTLSVGGTSSITGTNTGDQTTISGNAGTATVLQTARNINGVSFNGSADITVTAAASTLTGTTLNATVVNSSLTSVGTITSGTWTGTTIAIANGGTGQTTANAAFNALSPMTTGGDIIYGGASGVGTRLANGSSGQVLTSNGGTSAPSWNTPASPSVATKTVAYTVVNTDGYLLFDMSGSSNASYAVTLETAVGNTGVTHTFVIKTGTGILSINTTSGQTVGTFASGVIKMTTVNDEITVWSDGTNWRIRDMRISIAARYHSSSTSVPTLTTTKVVWSTSDRDPLNLMSSGTFTAPFTGWYQINSSLNLSGTFTTDQQNKIFIYVNGSPIAEDEVSPVTGLSQIGLNIMDCYYVTTGQTIEIYVRPQAISPSITATANDNYVSIIWVGN